MTRWTDFVKQWAKEHNLSYMCSTSKPECSRDYREQYQAVKPTKKQALEKTKIKPAWANIQVQKIPQPPSRGRTYTEPTLETKNREHEGMALEDRYRAKGHSSVMKPVHIEQEMEPIKSVRMFEKKMKKIKIGGRPEPPSREGIETEHGEAKVVSIQPFAGGDEPFLPPSAVFVPSAVAKINFHTSWLYEPVFPQSALEYISKGRSDYDEKYGEKPTPVMELDREDKEAGNFHTNLTSSWNSLGEKTEKIIGFDAGVVKKLYSKLSREDAHLPHTLTLAKTILDDIITDLRKNRKIDYSSDTDGPVEPKTGEEIYQEVIAELSGRREKEQNDKAEAEAHKERERQKSPYEKAMDKYIFETTGYLRRVYEIHKKDGRVIPNEKKIQELKLKLATSFGLPPTWWDEMQDEGPMLK